MTRTARQDADGIDLVYPGPGGVPHYRGRPIRDAAEFAQIQLAITARRAERRADRLYGTPCIACGAPTLGGIGHDDGCVAAPALTTPNGGRP